MPKKKPRLPEAELHALIVKEAKYRLGCEDFEPEFTLSRLESPGYGTPPPGLALPVGGSHVTANWDVRDVNDATSWRPECAQAFMDALGRARRKFDVALPM